MNECSIYDTADGTDESHVPTANRVAEVFAANDDSNEDEDNDEDLDVIDFEDMIDLETKVTTTGTSLDFAPNAFLGVLASTKRQEDVDSMVVEHSTSLTTKYEAQPLFVVDVTPIPLPDPPPPPSLDSDDDEEVIVYEAPNPRPHHDVSSGNPIQDETLHTTSVLTGLRLGVTEPQQIETASTADDSMKGLVSEQEPAHIEVNTEPSVVEVSGTSNVSTDMEVAIQLAERPPSPPPIQDPLSGAFSSFATPSKRAPAVNPRHQFTASGRSKARIMTRRKERRVQRKKLSSFASRAIDLQDSQWETKPDPFYSERRRGDSDVDWGSSDEGDAAANATAEGMDVDPELLGDVGAMKSFVQSVGAGFTTMDDIEDKIRMEEEDADSLDGTSSSEEDKEETAAVNLDEEQALGEPVKHDSPNDEDDEDEDEDDEFDEFDTSFQGRLERLRKQSRREGKSPTEGGRAGSDDGDGDLMDGNIMVSKNYLFTHEGTQDELQSLIEDNDAYFHSIVSGSFQDSEEEEDVMSFKHASEHPSEDPEAISAFNDTIERHKDKGKSLPAELQAQWEKDRQKKAENKRLRAEVRFMIASDPLAEHKGGKKGKKAMLAASRLDPTIHVLPNRVIDMVTLVQQIRRFLGDLDGPTSMSLPPTNKATRKSVHELANAFGLNSVSKGKGDARYTTLVKTTRSGFSVNEAKIGKIVRRSGGRPEFVNSGSMKPGKDSGNKGPRQQKDGEEVGKVRFPL